MVQAYLQRRYLAERVILPDVFRFLMLALCEVDLDEFKRDLLLDQDESGAAGSTGRIGSVEFDDHDQGLKEESGKRPKGCFEDPNGGSADDRSFK
jgi:hypothetical protein